MKRPRPNEPVLVENDDHLRHCRRAWKHFLDALFCPKPASNHDEWSGDKEFRSCFIKPRVCWHWRDVTRDSGETLDWAWRSQFGWTGKTERFTRIRLSKVGELFGRSSNVKWKNREWIIERRELPSYRNSRRIDRCRFHHCFHRWHVVLVSCRLRERHEMESSACARYVLLCSSISFVLSSSMFWHIENEPIDARNDHLKREEVDDQYLGLHFQLVDI